MWFFLGLALLAAEMVTTTFFVMFFGLAALVVAAAKLLGLNDTLWEIALFVTVGIGLVLTLRGKLLSRRSKAQMTPDLGQEVKVENGLGPGEETNVNYQGTPWKAVNVGSRPILKGETAKIVETKGIRLMIERKD